MKKLTLMAIPFLELIILVTIHAGVSIYFKQSLPLIKRDDLSKMQEARSFFPGFFRLPSKSHDELKNFCSELNLLLTNIKNNQPACSTDKQTNTFYKWNFFLY